MIKFDMNSRRMIALTVVVLVVLVVLLLQYFPPTGPPPAPPEEQAPPELPKVNPSIAQALTPGKCPANQCRNWIFGSCSKKQLNKERECFRYGAFPDCTEETYYDSHTEGVEACDEKDCPAGKAFSNYTCV